MPAREWFAPYLLTEVGLMFQTLATHDKEATPQYVAEHMEG